MGSGMSGLYSGTHGSSQPYAASYAVISSIRDHDKEFGIYGDSGYRRNPTAVRLQSLIKGNYIVDKHTNRIFEYVIDLDGDIIVGNRHGNGARGDPTPHPTLIGGRNPRVRVAGLLHVRGGKIYSFDTRSGHFKPHERSLDIAHAIFSRLSWMLFHKSFRRDA